MANPTLVTPGNSNDGAPTYDFRTLGKSGLNRNSGYISEELLPRLTGNRAAKVYREMGDNDATVGAILFAIESLLKGVEFRVNPADESLEAKACALFLEECLADTAHTWEDFLSEVLSMLPFGWAYFEVVYKMRVGPDAVDSTCRSRFSDGRIGWRKFSLRAQDTLDHWEFDSDGGLRGMHQRAPPDYLQVFLPIEKAVLFRTKCPKNNPEGRSLLRNSYRSWFFLKRLQEIEVVGIERDLSGLPVMEVPPAMMMPDAPESLRTVRASLEKMIQEIRRDEREGCVVPAESYTDETGQAVVSGYKLKLLTTGGRRAVDITPSIDRYQRDIARTLLAEFIFLGSDPNGSRSLADSKTSTFASALGAILDSIVSTFTRYAIEPLLKLNGFPEAQWPTLVHGDIETPDLTALSGFVGTLISAGALAPDAQLERYLRQQAHLPQQDLGLDEPMNVGPAPEDTGDPRPEYTPGATPPEDAPATNPTDANVASSAMNGSQVASLKELLMAAVAGELPLATVRAMLPIAFPLVTEAQVDAMLMGIVPRPAATSLVAAPPVA